MQLKGFVSAVSALLWCWSLVSASTVTFLGPTGIRNRNNICYMNALLSSLYDVTPFRKAVYDHYYESNLIRAIANVFARKQLNYLPAIDLERDMISTINNFIPEWRFGDFQDIDEFLKSIFLFFPESLFRMIGYVSRDRVTTADERYLINPGFEIRNPMVNIVLPPGSAHGMNLQDLVNEALSLGTYCDFQMKYDEHPMYFAMNEIQFPTVKFFTTIKKQPKVLEYGDIVPVFIGRRCRDTGSASKDFRADEINVPELITFPLQDGRTEHFTLISFAVYRPGHYYAYAKHFPSREWFCYNDQTVTKPDNELILKELRKNAVMLFYVRAGRSVHTRIPEEVENFAIFSMTVQHMRDTLVPRIEKLVRDSKKKS